jgi:hypothetical protein
VVVVEEVVLDQVSLALEVQPVCLLVAGRRLDAVVVDAVADDLEVGGTGIHRDPLADRAMNVVADDRDVAA